MASEQPRRAFGSGISNSELLKHLSATCAHLNGAIGHLHAG